MRACLLGSVATVCSIASADPAVATPPPGSVFAEWNYTPEELAALVPPARPEDVASPEAILSAAHESVNGPKGTWNSDRLHSLCLPNASFTEIDKDSEGRLMIRNVPLKRFLEEVQELHDTTAWYETVQKLKVAKVFKKHGGLAAVFYHGYASDKPGGKHLEDGDSVATLLYDGKRWWIVSDSW